MKRICVVILSGCLLGLVGCHDSKQAEADKAAQAMRQSFESAPEPLKTAFQELTAAVAANDFLKAKASLDQFQKLQGQMTPEQQSAVAEQRQTLMVNAAAAAQKGDSNAVNVIQAVRYQR